jgi:hypothetical protein
VARGSRDRRRGGRVGAAPTARELLEPIEEFPAWRRGIAAMRALAADFPSWSAAPDWSWAARFGYQIIIKRGAAGSLFRSL